MQMKLKSGLDFLRYSTRKCMCLSIQLSGLHEVHVACLLFFSGSNAVVLVDEVFMDMPYLQVVDCAIHYSFMIVEGWLLSA